MYNKYFFIILFYINHVKINMNKAIKKLLKNKMRFYVIIISVVSLLVIIGLLLVNKKKIIFNQIKCH